MDTKQTQHTPGPWTVKDDKRTGVSVFSTDSEYSVCHMSIAAEVNRGPAVARANARLIAAAPETAADRDRLAAENKVLREALQMIESFWADVEDNDPTSYAKVRNNARAALAKAKGI